MRSEERGGHVITSFCDITLFEKISLKNFVYKTLRSYYYHRKKTSIHSIKHIIKNNRFMKRYQHCITNREELVIRTWKYFFKLNNARVLLIEYTSA